MSDPSAIIAQVTNPILGTGLGAGWGYFNTIIPRFINIGFLIAILAFVFIFIIGSFQWITAGGDKEKLATAREKITHALIGLIVVLLIFFITQFVNYVLGINIGQLATPFSTGEDVDGECVFSTGVCSCSCPAGYYVLSGCNAACTGVCRCIPNEERMPTPSGGWRPPHPSGWGTPAATTCTDSDGGQVAGVPGFTILSSVAGAHMQYDNCVGNTLDERYCQNNEALTINIFCENGCVQTSPGPTGSGYCRPTNPHELTAFPYINPTATPTPTFYIVPTFTPTPLPTSTPRPTSTPIPTNTPVPTVRPSSTPTSVPTNTPSPTPTPLSCLPSGPCGFVPCCYGCNMLLNLCNTTVAFCTDSDGGVNYGTFGYTTSVNGMGVYSSSSDSCTSSTTLNEASCRSATPISQAYDCSVGGTQPFYGCVAGRCCISAGGGCSTDTDCCLGNICNAGRCQSATNIILNEASGMTCHDLCYDRGFQNGNSCQSIGTNNTADNGMSYVNNCVLTNTYGCDNGILASVSSPLCNGYRTNWTYCNCVPN